MAEAAGIPLTREALREGWLQRMVASGGYRVLSEEELRASQAEVLRRHPPGEDLWLFAYGSLLWKPACETVESRPAAVRGWHRSFCYRVARFRGTRDRPGLMMALDRGGRCRGMLQRVPRERAAAGLDALLRREVVVKPGVNIPRWLTAETADGPVRALAFVVNRKSPHYAGRLGPEAAADIVATAAGHWGSCADYLRETVTHLEALGIRDRTLWRLQALVAERIRAGFSEA